jgi:diaminopimelate epimerase
MMTLNFTKMHGIGNDYIYFDCTTFDFPEPEKAAVVLSDRHFAIGSDGIVLIQQPSQGTNADFRMRMFNADGSEAEMCGNAVRCIGKFIFEKGLLEKDTIRLETAGGIKTLFLSIRNSLVEEVRVNMGRAILEPALIPCTFTETPPVNQQIEVNGEIFTGTAVSMGNPHFVIFVDDITDFLVHTIGPLIEKHPCFPAKTNVEFVKIESPRKAVMRVWERGSGETLACGTGACAVAVAGNLQGLIEKKSVVSLIGGELKIEISESGEVFKTGPATTVFEGTIRKIW